MQRDEFPKLGATGQFPSGKLNPSDEGQLQYGIGRNKENNKVIMDFGKPIAWLALNRSDAFTMGKALMKHAKKLRG
jgi:hypothetical protein